MPVEVFSYCPDFGVSLPGVSPVVFMAQLSADKSAQTSVTDVKARSRQIHSGLVGMLRFARCFTGVHQDRPRGRVQIVLVAFTYAVPGPKG